MERKLTRHEVMADLDIKIKRAKLLKLKCQVAEILGGFAGSSVPTEHRDSLEKELKEI
jgi:hypothetical protein